MKFLKETFTAIFFLLILIYFLFSVSNGSWNFYTWSLSARQGYAFAGGMLSLFTFAVQIFRHIDFD